MWTEIGVIVTFGQIYSKILCEEKTNSEVGSNLTCTYLDDTTKYKKATSLSRQDSSTTKS